MSNVGWQERIRETLAYKTGQVLRPVCLASNFSRVGAIVQAQTMKATLKEMAANGELKQVGESYYRPMPARVWLVRAWRKRDNRAIGLQVAECAL